MLGQRVRSVGEVRDRAAGDLCKFCSRFLSILWGSMIIPIREEVSGL